MQKFIEHVEEVLKLFFKSFQAASSSLQIQIYHKELPALHY